MFVEIYGRRETGPGAGVARSSCGGRRSRRRAAANGSTSAKWVGDGNEPSWRLDITARDLLMSLLGGTAGQRAAHGGLQRQDGSIVYTAAEGPELTVTIDERRCVDSSSGSLFAYRVEVQKRGQIARRLRGAQSGHAGAMIV